MTTMLNAIFFFLAIGGLLVLALACLSTREPAATVRNSAHWGKRPTWSQEAKWPEIKSVWLEWHVRCQLLDAPRQKATLSWGRTMALCAAICLMGVVLKVELDEQESAPRLASASKHSPSAAAPRFESRTAQR